MHGTHNGKLVFCISTVSEWHRGSSQCREEDLWQQVVEILCLLQQVNEPVLLSSNGLISVFMYVKGLHIVLQDKM